MVKSSSLLLWIHMYTSFQQIYEQQIMHFLICFAWGQTKRC